MKKLSAYPWRAAYVSAVLEIDDAKVTGRIFEAITAIEQRRSEHIKMTEDESRALAAADLGIQTLITERTDRTV